ncbi:MAG: rod shape-determining protein RodA, partial [Gammaproteobacteria bacterium]|nr:rod shape-determining protein RodA [Gammaproteobacteria bacterium]
AVLYSASDQSMATVQRQAMRFGIALGVMFVFAQIPPHHYKRWSPWLYAMGLLMLLGVLFMGVGAKGAQRWLEIPGLPRFQPSEIMKIAVPMALAAYFADRYLPPRVKHVFCGLLFIAIPTLLIAKQPDLGTSLLICASGLFVLLFSGIRWRFIFGFGALFTACLPLLWMIMKDYQKQRVMTFLNPESDLHGAGWNIVQSKIAIGSGGLNGKGWLHSTQSQLDFLPESHTDFIIAVFAEEFGFVGVLALLLLYLLIVTRCLFIAARADETYARLLAGSLTLTFFFYFFVNIGMVTGLLPVVGLPLPLISYGGTSIVTLFVGFGMLMSIQTHKKVLPQ